MRIQSMASGHTISLNKALLNWAALKRNESFHVTCLRGSKW